MTVLIPSAAIQSRWNGALQARLRQAPLERFMRSRGQKWVSAGDSRITDNLACATIYFVGEALDAYARTHPEPLAGPQFLVVGHIACAVCDGLSTLVKETASWRIAALVATARLLAPYMSLDEAAHLAGSAARAYGASLDTTFRSIEGRQIGTCVAYAVTSNEDDHATNAVTLILLRLSAPPSAGMAPARRLPSALAYDLGGATLKSSTT